MKRVKIPIKHLHSLTRYGYSTAKSEKARHTALNKALKADSPLTISRRLQALSTFHKNNDIQLARLVKEDAEWVKAQSAGKRQGARGYAPLKATEDKQGGGFRITLSKYKAPKVYSDELVQKIKKLIEEYGEEGEKKDNVEKKVKSSKAQGARGYAPLTAPASAGKKAPLLLKEIEKKEREKKKGARGYAPLTAPDQPQPPSHTDLTQEQLRRQHHIGIYQVSAHSWRVRRTTGNHQVIGSFKTLELAIRGANEHIRQHPTGGLLFLK